MHSFTKRALSVAVAMAASQLAFAGTATYFVPLTKSEPVEAPNAVDELNVPWIAPAGVMSRNLMNMEEAETTPGQSVQRVNAGSSSSMFDMLAFNNDGRYLFIPHETPVGAGTTRYDMLNDTSTLIFAGDQAGAGADGIRGNQDDQWDNDFGAFDPSRWTPNGTLWLAEEWSGLGRVVEVCDPMATPADPTASALVEGDCAAGADWSTLPIANVSHEGINFSVKHFNEVIYFIDEDRSGSIYKMVFKTPGDYAGGGQTFVLARAGYTGDVTINWNSGSNGTPAVLQSRFGMGEWVALTDVDGNPLPGIHPVIGSTTENCGAVNAEDPCRVDEIRPGRTAADDAGGLPWGRPEDMAIGMLPNGNEMLYITITSEDSVISIEETANGPMIRSFASDSGANTGGISATPKNAGFAPTTARLNAPDNLAIDSLGNVYIIEDAPNSSMTGGDVWFARDMDNDGVAESIDHFLSLQVNGAESTGMIFNPAEPTKFAIAVQHPRTTDLTDADNDGVRDAAGPGDAVWEFDIAGVMPPDCTGPRSQWMTFNSETRRWVRACSTQRDYNVVEQVEASDTSDSDFANP